MAKIDINFNNNKYTIDESALSAASSALKSHLSSVMNGQGATINFDGVTYSIDSTKLTNATNDFVSHLGTISGSGHKVKVNGVEYSVGSDKVGVSVSELIEVFKNLTLINGKLVEFDCELTGREYYTFGNDKLLIKMTNDILTEDDLIGSVLTYVLTELFSSDAIVGEHSETITAEHIESQNISATGTAISVIMLDEPMIMVFNEDFMGIPMGTYFMLHGQYDTVKQELLDIACYTKSISCLTESAPEEPKEKIVEFNGDLPNSEYYTISGSDMYFIKISDKMFTQDELIGSTVVCGETDQYGKKLMYSGETFEVTDKNIASQSISETGFMIAIANDGGTMLACVLSEPWMGIPSGTFLICHALDFGEDGFDYTYYAKSISCVTEHV